MRESRERCLAAIAAAIGRARADLQRDIQRAVMMHGHECYQIAIAAHDRDDATARTTTPAPPHRDGTYRDVPTRVDRVRIPLNRKAR